MWVAAKQNRAESVNRNPPNGLWRSGRATLTGRSPTKAGSGLTGTNSHEDAGYHRQRGGEL